MHLFLDIQFYLSADDSLSVYSTKVVILTNGLVLTQFQILIPCQDTFGRLSFEIIKSLLTKTGTIIACAQAIFQWGLNM
ncbi:MAG: hypothetical protein JEZ03_11755 [Bacteroidales bacterium]|nr:hypothetical protein [Bacteroidales bacterium]